MQFSLSACTACYSRFAVSPSLGVYSGIIASYSAESNTPYKAFAKGIRFYVSPYFLQAIVVLTYNILTQYVSKKRISIMYLVIEYLSLSLCTDQFCFILFARSCGYDCRSSKSSTASSSMVIIGQSKPGLCYLRRLYNRHRTMSRTWQGRTALLGGLERIKEVGRWL